jgi:hypothetical protein
MASLGQTRTQAMHETHRSLISNRTTEAAHS